MTTRNHHVIHDNSINHRQLYLGPAASYFIVRHRALSHLTFRFHSNPLFTARTRLFIQKRARRQRRRLFLCCAQHRIGGNHRHRQYCRRGNRRTSRWPGRAFLDVASRIARHGDQIRRMFIGGEIPRERSPRFYVRRPNVLHRTWLRHEMAGKTICRIRRIGRIFRHRHLPTSQRNYTRSGRHLQHTGHHHRHRRYHISRHDYFRRRKTHCERLLHHRALYGDFLCFGFHRNYFIKLGQSAGRPFINYPQRLQSPIRTGWRIRFHRHESHSIRRCARNFLKRIRPWQRPHRRRRRANPRTRTPRLNFHDRHLSRHHHRLQHDRHRLSPNRRLEQPRTRRRHSNQLRLRARTRLKPRRHHRHHRLTLLRLHHHPRLVLLRRTLLRLFSRHPRHPLIPPIIYRLGRHRLILKARHHLDPRRHRKRPHGIPKSNRPHRLTQSHH